jgi:hypothetical protein
MDLAIIKKKNHSYPVFGPLLKNASQKATTSASGREQDSVPDGIINSQLFV